MKKKKTMVFGASPNPSRYSHLAVRRLENNGIEVVALGRRAGQIGNTTIQTDYPDKIDQLHTISLYLGAKHQPEYYDYLLSLKPKRVLFNPGTENFDFVERLEKAGIEAEMACTLALLSIGAY